jgi:hypothetical protein
VICVVTFEYISRFLAVAPYSTPVHYFVIWCDGRLCRALAIPGRIAKNLIEGKITKQYADRLNDLEYLTDKTIHTLENYVKNEDDKLITANLKSNQKEAIYTDITDAISKVS